MERVERRNGRGRNGSFDYQSLLKQMAYLEEMAKSIKGEDLDVSEGRRSQWRGEERQQDERHLTSSSPQLTLGESSPLSIRSTKLSLNGLDSLYFKNDNFLWSHIPFLIP